MNEIEINSRNMVESPVKAHLENAIEQNPSNPDGKEDEFMSYKYKERVKVGEVSGRPVFAWACANTKDELHQAIAALLNTPCSPVQATISGQILLWEERAWHWFDTFHKPRLRAKTLIKDKCLMRRHIIPAFEGRSITTITTSDVQVWLSTLSGFCKSQVRDIMNLMKSVFADAVEDGVILRNPMVSERIHNPSQKPDQIRRALSPAEQRDIIEHLPLIKKQNARRFLAFLMFTPLRPSEIYGLRWEDYDPDTRTFFICKSKVFADGKAIMGDTKTEQSKRHFQIDPQLLEYLEPVQSEGFVIEDINTESAARWMWKTIGKTIDLHGMTPYMGRHTFASNMNRAGIPLKTAMVMMGHADERMLLRRYTHVDADDLSNAHNKMSAFMASLSEPGENTSSDAVETA